MMPSASNIERAMLCSASTSLPVVDQPQSAAAKRGTVIHAVIASELRGFERPDIGRHRISVDMETLKSWLGDGELRAELAMEYTPRTQETVILGENIGREYARKPGRIYGTADIVVLRQRAMVVDIKTGSQRVTQVEDNWQLRTLAVMVASAYQVASVVGALAYLNRDGSWCFESTEWGSIELDDFADVLASKSSEWAQAELDQADGWGPLPTPSYAACRWCPCECEARIRDAA